MIRTTGSLYFKLLLLLEVGVSTSVTAVPSNRNFGRNTEQPEYNCTYSRRCVPSTLLFQFLQLLVAGILATIWIQSFCYVLTFRSFYLVVPLILHSFSHNTGPSSVHTQLAHTKPTH